MTIEEAIEFAIQRKSPKAVTPVLFNKLQSGGLSADQISSDMSALKKRLDVMIEAGSAIEKQLAVICGSIALVAYNKRIPLEKLQ